MTCHQLVLSNKKKQWLAYAIELGRRTQHALEILVICLPGSSVDFVQVMTSLRAVVRSFAIEEIQPRAAVIGHANIFSADLWKKLAELGLLGLTANEEYGGSNLGSLAQMVAMEELSRASAAVGLSYVAHSCLCVSQLQRSGTDAQKAKYLPKLVSGEHIGAFAMSGCPSGASFAGMSVRAECKGDSFVLNGSTMRVANGSDANTIVVYAPTGSDVGRSHTTAFIVEKGCFGMSCVDNVDRLDMRGSNTCSFFFEDCEVPEENVLGDEGNGEEVLLSGFDSECMVFSCGSLGIMAASMDIVLPYLHDRGKIGRGTSEFQLMRRKMADMYTTWQACRAYTFAVGQACFNGDCSHSLRKDAAEANRYVAEKATWLASEAIQMVEGSGDMNHSSLSRNWRDAKLFEIVAGELCRLHVESDFFS